MVGAHQAIAEPLEAVEQYSINRLGEVCEPHLLAHTHIAVGRHLAAEHVAYSHTTSITR